jgi:hypothetical protein
VDTNIIVNNWLNKETQITNLDFPSSLMGNRNKLTTECLFKIQLANFDATNRYFFLIGSNLSKNWSIVRLVFLSLQGIICFLFLIQLVPIIITKANANTPKQQYKIKIAIEEFSWRGWS